MTEKRGRFEGIFLDELKRLTEGSREKPNDAVVLKAGIRALCKVYGKGKQEQEQEQEQEQHQKQQLLPPYPQSRKDDPPEIQSCSLSTHELL